MRRVSASYNSPHICTKSTSCVTNISVKTVLRHVHDIHGEISVGSGDPLRVNTTLVRGLRYVYENHTTYCDMSTSPCELIRVLHDPSRICTIKYDILRYITTFLRNKYDNLRVSLDFRRYHMISIRPGAFWNKKEYALSICGHHLISNNNEYNKYDSTAMTVHFSTFHCTFFFLGCILLFKMRQSECKYVLLLAGFWLETEI